MNPYNFSLLFFSFCTFFISILIWLKRSDRIGWRYFIFSCFVSLWSFGVSVMIGDGVTTDEAYFWGVMAEVGATFIPATWIHFISVYILEESRYSKVFIPLYLSAMICTAVAAFSPTLFIVAVEPAVGFLHYFRPGPFFHLYAITFFAAIPYGFVMLISFLRKAHSAADRTNLIAFIAATMVAYIGATPTFLPMYEVMFPQHGLFLLPFYPFVMAYFMIRKNLFDEKDLVQAAHRDKLAAIGTLSASINHEIRNPLYIIHGMAESFLHNFKGEETNLAAVKKESVAVLEKTAHQAKRAMEIMSQLSMFAKQPQGDAVADAGMANLQECLNNVLPLVRHEMTLDKITMENHLPHDLPEIKANPRQIEEVFFNLIVNACQALKAEGGSIKIVAEHAGENVTITLEDNGPGISKPQLAKIFQPFYTTKDEGTGLGLYIVKQLVEKNAGKISVESEAGGGTRFLLEFSC